MEINEDVVRKVLETVDVGLMAGLGIRVPGQMCVEAAVCYALGLPHSDNPKCVDEGLRLLKINLNDNSVWKSSFSRAAGLRRLAVAQLGSKDVLDRTQFANRVFSMTVQMYIIPFLLRKVNYTTAKSILELPDVSDSTFAHKWNLLERKLNRNASFALCDIAFNIRRANECTGATRINFLSHAVDTMFNTEYTEDETIKAYCEDIVQILIDMKAPGCEYLYLTEANG